MATSQWDVAILLCDLKGLASASAASANKASCECSVGDDLPPSEWSKIFVILDDDDLHPDPGPPDVSTLENRQQGGPGSGCRSRQQCTNNQHGPLSGGRSWLTNDIVYKRIAPGVLKELKSVSPKNDNGQIKHKCFQKLTSNVGYPKLRDHLGTVVAVMKLSSSYPDLISMLDRFYTRYGDTLPLPFDHHDTDDGKGI